MFPKATVPYKRCAETNRRIRNKHRKFCGSHSLRTLGWGPFPLIMILHTHIKACTCTQKITGSDVYPLTMTTSLVSFKVNIPTAEKLQTGNKQAKGVEGNSYSGSPGAKELEESSLFKGKSAPQLVIRPEQK